MPNEIMVGPLEVYLSPVGTAFPDVDEVPAAAWKLLGTNGTLNQAEGGITVSHPQTIKEHMNEGATGPIDAFRTGEGLEFSFTLEDMTAEQYTHAINGEAVTDTAAGTGTPGYRAINLYRGPTVKKYALLARGFSPYDPTLKLQYQVPICYQADNPAPAFNKSAPGALKLTFKALIDPNASTTNERFGKLIEQDATAL